MVKRKTAQKRLSRSIEDYLEAIHVLGLERDVVRVRDIARALGVSMPSVTGMLGKLKEQNLVSHERYESVSLTGQGRKRAEGVYRRHRGLKEFFEVVLGLSQQEAEEQACLLEHTVSEETLSRLAKLIDYIGCCKLGREHWVGGFHTYLKTGKLKRLNCRV